MTTPDAPRRQRRQDPLGRRALFSAADGRKNGDSRRPRDAGRKALFSASESQPGTVVLDCSACGARSRVRYGEFFARHLPFWLCAPWRRHSLLIRCPACEQRSWMAASWTP